MKIEKRDDDVCIVTTNVDELDTIYEALETTWCLPCNLYKEGYGCKYESDALRCKQIINELDKAVNDEHTEEP